MNVTKYMYYLDINIVRIRKILKNILPERIVNWVNKFRKQRKSLQFEFLENTYPWMSPNVWNEITSFYRSIPNPIVVEFGTGASTISHLIEFANLSNSRYVGIENDPEWFWVVVTSVLNQFYKFDIEAEMKLIIPENLKADQNAVDVEIVSKNIFVLLRLRNFQEGYLAAYNQPCNVVIIDGILRKECVEKVFSTSYLNEGGLLMLMEAGRGSDDWWEGKLIGENDYSKELEKMLSLGGYLIDGTGLDNWPNCKRKSPRPTSYYYPLEACKLIIPELDNNL